MHKIPNNYTASTLKESFHKISDYQKTYNLRNTNTDLAVSTPATQKRISQKKALDIAALCFGII